MHDLSRQTAGFAALSGAPKVEPLSDRELARRLVDGLLGLHLDGDNVGCVKLPANRRSRVNLIRRRRVGRSGVVVQPRQR